MWGPLVGLRCTGHCCACFVNGELSVTSQDLGFGDAQTWVQVPFLFLASYVSFGKLFHLCVEQISHLQNMGNINV